MWADIDTSAFAFETASGTPEVRHLPSGNTLTLPEPPERGAVHFRLAFRDGARRWGTALTLQLSHDETRAARLNEPFGSFEERLAFRRTHGREMRITAAEALQTRPGRLWSRRLPAPPYTVDLYRQLGRMVFILFDPAGFGANNPANPDILTIAPRILPDAPAEPLINTELGLVR
ncbi:MAG TPA: hypothetical protein ENK63_02675 [Rhodobacterales bacterium]|nr:hypothetical protein [Rhodobacterales bacterium]